MPCNGRSSLPRSIVQPREGSNATVPSRWPVDVDTNGFVRAEVEKTEGSVTRLVRKDRIRLALVFSFPSDVPIRSGCFFFSARPFDPKAKKAKTIDRNERNKGRKASSSIFEDPSVSIHSTCELAYPIVFPRGRVGSHRTFQYHPSGSTGMFRWERKKGILDPREMPIDERGRNSHRRR